MAIFYRNNILNRLLSPPRSKLHSSSFSSITKTYNKYHAALPFTEKEKILLNNTIISLLNDANWISSLTHKGIPSFFVRNHEFRNKFIEYIDKSNEARMFVRENLNVFMAYNLNERFESEYIPVNLTEYISSFVVDNMPNLMVACQTVRHLADFRSFESDPTNKVGRKVYVHIGPPNSGKTHEAISRLSKAKNGIYCSPLRLLAWEMHSRLNRSKVPCALLTGQEKVDNNENHISCTVEMVPYERSYEVAVLDEMQMVGDRTRGYAWTKAFWGLKTKELHVCGSNACLTLARKLADIRGDTLEVHKHARLGKLKVLDNVVKLESLEPGDCVVCFSRNEAFKLRDQIESTVYEWDPRDTTIGNTQRKNGDRPITSIVYGSLPPETRCKQIESFNNRDTKILIASDVIGMGVNVSIRRIIFNKLTKYDGSESRVLNAAEVQQIAGRAGRYGLECGEGEVSCVRKKDLPVLKELMSTEPPQIEKAVISPSPEVFEAFNLALNQATGSRHSLSDVTQLITSMAKVGKNFAMCDFVQVNTVAKCLEGINLPFEVYKHYLLVPMGSPLTSLVVRAYAASHALLNKVKISNIINEACLELNFDDLNRISANEEVKRLELLYEALDIYTWLSNKFPSVYVDGNAVAELKTKISAVLSRLLSEVHEGSSEELSDAYISREILRPEFTIA
nr:ATP-dependent RNA helicase [Theileria orientalis]